MNRISKIQVNKLFGLFDHEVVLRPDDRITIIHGPNGFGKTAILRLTSALVNGRDSELRSIRYESFSMQMENGTKIEVCQKLIEDGQLALDLGPQLKVSQMLVFRFYEDGQNISEEFQDIQFDVSKFIERFIPHLTRIDFDTWDDRRLGSTLSSEDILNIYSDELPTFAPKRGRKKKPNWLSDIQKKTSVRFIQVNRLLRLTKDRRKVRHERRHDSAVMAYSQEFREAIRGTRSEYAGRSQALDRTFPMRLVKNKPPQQKKDTELRRELAALERRRAELVDVGLLPILDSDFEVPKGDLDPGIRNVLWVYVEDVKEKLSVFDNLAAKVELLQDVVNDRFKYKRLRIDETRGFFFESWDGDKLSPDDLSSGEQHEMILLYEFLFKVDKNSTVLLDEPELSLHVGWQINFLKDLARILKLVPFDVLIATHSPQIISDRWDLTVELEGPELEF